MRGVKMISRRDKKKMIKVNMVLGIVFLCGIIILLAWYYVKHQKNEQEKERERQRYQQEVLEWNRETEANYKKLEKLFIQQEEDFDCIVENIKEENLTDKVENMVILFRNDEEIQWAGENLGREEICFYNGELLNDKEHCSQETYDAIKNNEELYNALKAVANKKMIDDIYWIEEKKPKEIEFTINTAFTSFITNNNGVNNSFIYSEKDGREEYGYKWIKDNWYMWISPRPE